jgi:dUTP pyrophosphatase
MWATKLIEVKIQTRSDAPDVVKNSASVKGSVPVRLFAALRPDESIVLNHGERAAIPTGISLSMPNGIEAQILTDENLAATHGIAVLNNPGTIDPDYRGEIAAIIINMGNDPYLIIRGSHVANMRFARFVTANLVEVKKLDETSRGLNGLGSTGHR